MVISIQFFDKGSASFFRFHIFKICVYSMDVAKGHPPEDAALVFHSPRDRFNQVYEENEAGSSPEDGYQSRSSRSNLNISDSTLDKISCRKPSMSTLVIPSS